MRLERAIISGLKGIYRKSGKKIIDIDFNLCKYNIILISGPNGSGKTSLLTVLNPLPDNHQMYLENEEGSKILIYTHEGIKYSIKIIYPVDSYGKRTTTKAYITKEIMNNCTDLNPNGNVNSYKNCIYQEFGLDPNFIALSKLSSENRGIVDLTPSERKKYVSLLLEATTEYDNMNRVLLKRASNFKSMLNSIVAKIESIGEYEYLVNEAENIKGRIEKLQSNRDLLIKRLAEAETAARMLDPENTIKSRYQNLEKESRDTVSSIGWLKTQLVKYGFEINDDISSLMELKTINQNKILAIKDNIGNIERTIQENTVNLKVAMSEKNKYDNDIRMIQGKIDSLSSEGFGEELEYNIIQLDKEIETYNDILSKYREYGVGDVTKDEFMVVLRCIQNANETFNTISSSSYHQSKLLASNILKDRGTVDEQKLVLSEYNKRLEFLKDKKIKLQADISACISLIESTKILLDRPSDCSNNDCPFIVSALKASLENPQDKLPILESEIKDLNIEIQSLEDSIKTLVECIEIMSLFISIEKSINVNKEIFNKLPKKCDITGRDVLIGGLLRSDGLMQYINILNSLSDWINASQMKQLAEDKLKDLNIAFSVFRNNKSTVKELVNSLETLNNDSKKLSNDITNFENIRSSLRDDITAKENAIKQLTVYNEKIDELMDLYNKKANIESDLLMIENSIKSIELAINSINNINTDLISVNKDLQPLDDEYKRIIFSIQRHKEYSDELEIYQNKFNIVDTLRRFTAPSKEGIQNLFIKLYMGTTLKLANELLQLMFNGEMQLQDYIINDKEFRIPCKSEQTSILNSDISSCSTGEKCMISLVLGTVLFVQASNKYNIIEWDEMDNGLDKFNKANFIPLTMRIMQLFKIQQCIMISHATESVFEDVDIISLGAVNNEIPIGNVIFKL